MRSKRDVVPGSTAGALIHVAVPAAAAILLHSALALAQTPTTPMLNVGDQVRLTAPSVSPKRIEGSLVALDRETLSVVSGADGARMAVPRAGIATLEVRRGTRSHWVAGALVGAAAFGLAGGIVLSNPPSSASEFQIDAGAVAASAAVGAAVGALGGALWRTDRWITVPRSSLTLDVRPVPGRGAALSVRVSF